jgi:predicted enzyme related to lactoylglutathione lyase
LAIPPDMPADLPSHWVTYIGTRDVDGTAAAAVRAGGSILKAPDDIKGAGRYAVLNDPQGAAFAILDPENSRPEPEGMPPAGSFSWHELSTSDNEAAFAFYSGLFGWEALARHDMGQMGIYLIFGTKGVQRGGMMIRPSDYPGPANWLPYISIPNADEAFAVAQATGGKGMVPPMTVPGGTRIAQVMDPTGAMIAVHSPGDSKMAPAAAEKPKAAAKPKPAAKPKAKPKAKAKARPKAKAKAAPAKKKTAKAKPAPKKKVMKKAARKKVAKKPAPKKRAPARKKSKAARRKR